MDNCTLDELARREKLRRVSALAWMNSWVENLVRNSWMGMFLCV